MFLLRRSGLLKCRRMCSPPPLKCRFFSAPPSGAKGERFRGPFTLSPRQRSPETPLGALPLDPASKKPIPESPHPTPEGEKELGDTPNPGRRASRPPAPPARRASYLLHLSPGGLHISFFLSYVLNLSMSMRSMSMENKTEWGA